MDKTQSRLRRARQTRVKIAELQVARLAVHRTNTHIYAQVFSPCGTKVLASASTLEAEVRAQLADQTGKGGNVAAATLIGKRIADIGDGQGALLIEDVDDLAFARRQFAQHLHSLLGATRNIALHL